MDVRNDVSRDRAEAMHARDAACQSLGIILHGAGAGWAKVRMPVTETMVNGHGTAHGGYLFLLADAAFAFACNTHGPVAVAHHAEVTFLRPAAAGEVLLAEARERVRYGLNGIYDVTVTREDGTVVAEFRGHSVMLTGPRASGLQS